MTDPTTPVDQADLRLLCHTTTDGTTTRELALGDVPATLWAREDAAPGTPLVLLGHGGGQHRHHPATTGRARMLVDAGLRALALDVAGHGDRPRSPQDEQEVARLRAARGDVASVLQRYNGDLARRTVPEWRALLAALLAVPEIGAAPVGWWGVSLGTAVGLPLVAEEPLVRAAVLGLFWPATLLDAARRTTVPVRFLVQWDDELVPREQALALFDALGSPDKKLHANPGPHAAVPRSEAASAVRFLARHLTG